MGAGELGWGLPPPLLDWGGPRELGLGRGSTCPTPPTPVPSKLGVVVGGGPGGAWGGAGRDLLPQRSQT